MGVPIEAPGSDKLAWRVKAVKAKERSIRLGVAIDWDLLFATVL